jgi:hypothetical protein
MCNPEFSLLWAQNRSRGSYVENISGQEKMAASQLWRVATAQTDGTPSATLSEWNLEQVAMALGDARIQMLEKYFILHKNNCQLFIGY